MLGALMAGIGLCVGAPCCQCWCGCGSECIRVLRTLATSCWARKKTGKTVDSRCKVDHRNMVDVTLTCVLRGANSRITPAPSCANHTASGVFSGFRRRSGVGESARSSRLRATCRFTGLEGYTYRVCVARRGGGRVSSVFASVKAVSVLGMLQSSSRRVM